MEDSVNDQLSFADYPDYTYDLHHDHDNDSAILTHDHTSLSYFSSFSYSYYFYEYDFGFDHELRSILYIVVFFILLLLVIFGLLSNIIQLYGILAFPRVRQKVQHIFIANMTFMGIFYLSVPGVINVAICGIEAFGDLFHVKVGGSLYNLQICLQVMHTGVLFNLSAMITALAYDQYLVVVYPVSARKWRTPGNATKACVILWIIGLLVGIVDGLTFLYEYNVDAVILIKDPLLFVFFCLLPIILTTSFNLMVWSTLQKAHTATNTDNTAADNAQRFTQLREDGGLPGALIRAQDLPNNSAINLSFVVCWVLYHIVHLVVAFIWALKRFNHSIYRNGKDEIMVLIADMAVCFNVALNPFLYVVCNRDFRQHLYRVTYILVKCNSRSYSGHIDETEGAE